MHWTVPAGQLFGVKLRIHLTFFLLLIWLGLAHLAVGGVEMAVRGLAFIIGIFGCVVLHEFGHILTAQRYGITTRDVILLPIGGLARMEALPKVPLQEIKVALAGPLVNVVLAAAFLLLAGGIPASGLEVLTNPDAPLLDRLAFANLFLAVFNLIPAFPMDGGRVLRALLAIPMGRWPATQLAAHIGQFIAIGFGLLGLMTGNPLLIFIAFFVYVGAHSEAAMGRMEAFAEGLTVEDAMVSTLSGVEVGDPVSQAARVIVQTEQKHIPVLDRHHRLVGLLTVAELVRAMHEEKARQKVDAIMQTDLERLFVSAPLQEAVEQLAKQSDPALVIEGEDGRFLGLVTLENLAELMMLSGLISSQREHHLRHRRI